MVEKKLRPYQQQLIDDVRGAFASGHQAVCLQLGTGGGKTFIVSTMIKRALTKGNRSSLICHRQELVSQISRTLKEMDVPHGIIAAGSYPNLLQPVQVCSLQTLVNRMEKIKSPPLVVFDEAHHVAAATWKKVFHFLKGKGCKIIGLTATPERLDGKGLDEFFSHMVQGPTIEELIEDGYLSPYKPFAPEMVKMDGVHTRMGDYAKDELEELMDKPSITGDVVQHYMKYAAGKKAIVFCVSIRHSQHIVEEFNLNGIKAVHVDGTTPAKERAESTAAFASGDVKVMSNVDLFGEGYDVPSAEIAILVRPTKSVSLHLQQCGRVLRPVYAEGMPLDTAAQRRAAIAAGPKPYAILLDHTGNLLRLGLPNEEREWSLKGREKKKAGESEKKIATRQCPKCYFVQPSKHKECQDCGHVFEVMSRELEERSGELVELTKSQQKELAQNRAKEAKKEQSMARSLDQLIQLGRTRGYKQPEAWANYIIKARAHG